MKKKKTGTQNIIGSSTLNNAFKYTREMNKFMLKQICFFFLKNYMKTEFVIHLCYLNDMEWDEPSIFQISQQNNWFVSFSSSSKQHTRRKIIFLSDFMESTHHLSGLFGCLYFIFTLIGFGYFVAENWEIFLFVGNVFSLLSQSVCIRCVDQTKKFQIWLWIYIYIYMLKKKIIREG